MLLIEETASHKVFLSHFGNSPVRFIQDKGIGSVMMNSEDVAKCLGFESLQDLLSNNPEGADMYLDAMNNGDVMDLDVLGLSDIIK